MTLPLRLTIFGPPRTKKTHNEVVLLPSKDGKGQKCPYCHRALKTPVQPSSTWRKWVREARILLTDSGEPLRRLRVGGQRRTLVGPEEGPVARWQPIDEEMWMVATFYRDVRTGDPLGFEQGLADLLEEWEIITNDRLCASWDGSRLRADPANPRVELTICRMPVESEENGQQALALGLGGLPPPP